jgi:hypothetical protein
MGASKCTLALLAAVTVAGGCSNPGSGGLIPPGGQKAAASTSERGETRLAIHVRIPRHRTSRLQRHFISAATKGIKLSFSGASTFTVTAGLTPASPNCSGSPLVCTIKLGLKPGSYHVTIGAYDLAPVGGSIPAGANLLSTASNVPAQVSPGATNDLAFTLDGVPANIYVGGFPNAFAGTGFLGKAFDVIARDADKNFIVGTYSTPIVLADSDSTGATSIATSGNDSPPANTLLSSSDVASINYSGALMAPAWISASAGATKSSAPFRVFNPYFVADYGNKAVKEIPASCSGSSCVTTVATYNNLVGIAIDGSGNLYIADASTNTVYKRTPCISGYCSDGFVGSGLFGLKGVAVDRSGQHVYASDGSTVWEFSAGCTSITCATKIAPGTFTNPYQIAIDASGNLFVADPTMGEVLKVPAGCSTSSCVVQLGGTTFNTPQGVAVDNAGNVYVADTFGSVYQMPDSCQSGGCAISIGGGFALPVSVAVDSFGDVLVADNGNNGVFYIPPNCSSSSCVSSLPGGFSLPTGVSAL